MEQLLAVGQRRQPFTAQYQPLKGHRSWVVELERRLDPDENTQPRPTGRRVQQQSKEFRAHLPQPAQTHPDAAAVVTHSRATFQHPGPRLVACDAGPDRYRPTNELDTCFGRLCTRQRQIHGRTSVHAFIIRYGEWAVFSDPTEPFEQVGQRFQQFDPAEFDQEYARFRQAQQRIQVLYRFRHQSRRCLKQLEQQWAEALSRKSRSVI